MLREVIQVWKCSKCEYYAFGDVISSKKHREVVVNRLGAKKVRVYTENLCDGEMKKKGKGFGCYDLDPGKGAARSCSHRGE